MISPEKLLGGNALSFNDQPYLAELFDSLTERNDPLTLVIGAGVSMDAGLPSWHRLLANMADTLRDERLKRMANKDPADPMRKAEHIIQLALRDTRKSTNEIIRDALYPEQGEVVPGELADAVARLAAATRGRIRIITTNFDEIIESALSAYLPDEDVESFAIDEHSEWQQYVADGKVGVLHVHGLVLTGDRTGKEPVVLTESHFLRHGSRVRQIILTELQQAIVVFLGVSVSDPNLVGPLWDDKRATDRLSGAGASEHARFLLAVPGRTAGSLNDDESIEYAIASAGYLEQHLALKPVFLKSYSQLIQAVSDMALAILTPGRFTKRARAAGIPSLRYGKRFERVLNDCYSAIGCERRRDVAIGPSGDNLSELLFEKLHAPKGPARMLADIRRRYSGRAPGWVPADEHFALFLWLRVRPHGSRTAPYAVRLIGTSAYTHREEWSFERSERIEASSMYSAALALYYGTTQALNLTPASDTDTWRGVIATPITIQGACSNVSLESQRDKNSTVLLDRLTVGAISLNTNCYVTKDPETGAVPEPQSVLSVVGSVGQLQAVAESMLTAALEILVPAT